MSRTLSLRTSLDTLKKDAKRWLKDLRAGETRAIQRLRAIWPDAPAEPALRDVQHALAREYGQESWIALRAALDDLALDRQSRAERIQAVHNHAWDGDPLVARRLVRRDPSLVQDSVFTAAICGDVEEVRRRLAADPQTAMRTGGSRQWTALAYVAYGRLDERNAAEIATLLLDAGADPNFQFDDGWGCPFKVLTGAIRLGEGLRPSHPQAIELVELLIERGADPLDAQALYNTSIVGDDVFWMDLLWRRCEARGETERWSSIYEQSLGGNMRVNTLNYLLGNAVGSNHPKRTAWLLDHGADPNTPQAYNRYSVNKLARLSGFADIAAMLEAHGAKVEPLTRPEAFRAALLAGDETSVRAMAADDPALVARPSFIIDAAMFGKAQAVRLMLELGAEVQATDHDQITPLHRAVQSNDLATVNVLLDAGADLEARENKWGGTPMGWSSALNLPLMAARLAGFSRDVRPLARQGFLAELDALLTSDPSLANWQGEHRNDRVAPAPLFCLPDDEDRAAEVARILLAHGADPTLTNGEGQTAEQYSRFRGLDEAADLMREAIHAR
jgi:hypothetical protein